MNIHDHTLRSSAADVTRDLSACRTMPASADRVPCARGTDAHLAPIGPSDDGRPVLGHEIDLTPCAPSPTPLTRLAPILAHAERRLADQTRGLADITAAIMKHRAAVEMEEVGRAG